MVATRMPIAARFVFLSKAMDCRNSVFAKEVSNKNGFLRLFHQNAVAIDKTSTIMGKE